METIYCMCLYRVRSGRVISLPPPPPSSFLILESDLSECGMVEVSIVRPSIYVMSMKYPGTARVRVTLVVPFTRLGFIMYQRYTYSYTVAVKRT